MLCVLLGGLIVSSSHEPAIPAADATGQPGAFASLYVWWALTNIVISVAFGFAIGIIGVALGTSLPLLVLEPFFLRRRAGGWACRETPGGMPVEAGLASRRVKRDRGRRGVSCRRSRAGERAGLCSSGRHVRHYLPGRERTASLEASARLGESRVAGAHLIRGATRGFEGGSGDLRLNLGGFAVTALRRHDPDGAA